MNDKKFYSNIPNRRLRKLIDSSSKTREQIAKGVLMDASTVTKYYNGDRRLTPEAITSFALYFDVSADFLLGITTSKAINKRKKYIEDYTGLEGYALDELHKLKIGAYKNESESQRHLDFLNYTFSQLMLCSYFEQKYNNRLKEVLEKMDELLLFLDENCKNINECDSELVELVREKLREIDVEIEYSELTLYKIVKHFEGIVISFNAELKNEIEDKMKILDEKFIWLNNLLVPDESEINDFKDEDVLRIDDFQQ